MRQLTVIGAIIAASLSASSVFAKGTAPEVVLKQGSVSGISDAGVDSFFNIPFAAPPVGVLRWRPPQKPERWRGVRDGSKMGPACPQTVKPALVAGGVAENQSEDCLQLNIWRPSGGKKLPVMVWLHGGANVIGSGTFPAFDGTAFAEQGVILVTVNYRLGPLGFFAHPALTAERPRGESIANYGLLDQLAALRWIQQNIAAFNGDPRRVTLFGESAGAIGVTTILAQEEAKGLFAQAIIQSGIGFFDPVPLGQAEKHGAVLAERAGARPTSKASGLRGLPVEALVKAGEVRTPGIVTGPIMDGRIVREAPWKTLARTESVDVPLLIGANSNEASVILAMGIKPSDALAYLGEDLEAGRSAYGADLPDDELARQILGDAWFVASARWIAERTAKGAPSYLYHFGYVPAARRAQAKGAAHGSEIPFLFGTLDYFETLAGPVTDEDRRFGEGLSACWIAFAKSGKPDCALVPEWPRYSAETESLAVLDEQPHVVEHFRKSQIDHLLEVYWERQRR